MDGEAVELTKDKDYTVSYSNNTNPGTATITIKGQGIIPEPIPEALRL